MALTAFRCSLFLLGCRCKFVLFLLDVNAIAGYGTSFALLMRDKGTLMVLSIYDQEWFTLYWIYGSMSSVVSRNSFANRFCTSREVSSCPSVVAMVVD